MNELQTYGTQLLGRVAEALAHGITTGHDWPNSQDELTRLQGARLLREAAAELTRLRSQLAAHAHDVHTCGPTCSRAGCVNGRLREALRAVFDSYVADEAGLDFALFEKVRAALQEPTEEKR